VVTAIVNFFSTYTCEHCNILCTVCDKTGIAKDGTIQVDELMNPFVELLDAAYRAYVQHAGASDAEAYASKTRLENVLDAVRRCVPYALMSTLFAVRVSAAALLCALVRVREYALDAAREGVPVHGMLREVTRFTANHCYTTFANIAPLLRLVRNRLITHADEKRSSDVDAERIAMADLFDESIFRLNGRDADAPDIVPGDNDFFFEIMVRTNVIEMSPEERITVMGRVLSRCSGTFSVTTTTDALWMARLQQNVDFLEQKIRMAVAVAQTNASDVTASLVVL
jgi:hypothetical protein